MITKEEIANIRNEALRKIVVETEIEEYDPDVHFTVLEYANALGISKQNAKIKLDRRVKAGELETLMLRMPNQRIQRAYKAVVVIQATTA